MANFRDAQAMTQIPLMPGHNATVAAMQSREGCDDWLTVVEEGALGIVPEPGNRRVTVVRNPFGTVSVRCIVTYRPGGLRPLVRFHVDGKYRARDRVLDYLHTAARRVTYVTG